MSMKVKTKKTGKAALVRMSEEMHTKAKIALTEDKTSFQQLFYRYLVTYLSKRIKSKKTGSPKVT